MSEYPLDDVHRLLEGLESILSTLRGSNAQRYGIEELPEIVETIHELGGWRNTQYLEKQIGINGALLNKFMKLRGSIPRGDAVKIADRLRTYLRSQDQGFSIPPVTKLSEKNRSKDLSPEIRQTVKTILVGEQWVAVGPSNQTKMKIAAISSLLDSIVEQIKHSNIPPDDQILTEIERQQLVAILETALLVLRAPLVEKGLLKKAQTILKKGAENAAEKGVQQGLGKLMESAGARILALLGNLFG